MERNVQKSPKIEHIDNICSDFAKRQINVQNLIKIGHLKRLIMFNKM